MLLSRGRRYFTSTFKLGSMGRLLLMEEVMEEVLPLMEEEGSKRCKGAAGTIIAVAEPSLL